MTYEELDAAVVKHLLDLRAGREFTDWLYDSDLLGEWYNELSGAPSLDVADRLDSLFRKSLTAYGRMIIAEISRERGFGYDV